MINLKINYNNNSSELCEIGRKYDTDNVTNSRHCHPYTLFYEGLFKNKKDEPLNIAELGILEGASLRMWQEYFTNAEIYGFEYNEEYIINFKENFDNDRITLSKIDVASIESIENSFSELNILYDIIIEDTTHLFEDQIRVIENTYQYLKPGGIMIIEDIFKLSDENSYINRLRPILNNFQDYYFIELDHVNKNSTGGDNDKLFILIKGGEEPIFKNTNKLTIITPCHRLVNIAGIRENINFDYVDEWIIVYDGRKIKKNPEFFKNQEDNKIKEYVYMCNNGGVCGNPQRNYALDRITNPNTLLYFLDDDNLIHPNLYRLMNVIDNEKLYTFNQYPMSKGNDIRVSKIDTAMYIVPYNLFKNIRWVSHLPEADGLYIMECYNNNKNIHVYVDNVLCYHNVMNSLKRIAKRL